MPGSRPHYNAVFRGMVDSVAPEGDILLVSMTVNRVWKGEIGTTTVVKTDAGEAACGFNFKPGSEYIVYAANDGGPLYTNVCMLTTPADYGAEHMAVLGDGYPPISQRATAPWLEMLLLFTGIAVVTGWLTRRRAT